MNRDTLILAAEVLEKAANYIDAVEDVKSATVKDVQTKTAETLRVRYEEATGEKMSEDMAAKLASADTSVVALIEKLAGAAQAPESLGGPGEDRDEPTAPRTHKEAAAEAEDRFATWLQS